MVSKLFRSANSTPLHPLRSVSLACLLLLSLNGYAVPVLWTVDAQFNDGGTLTGSFVYDASTNTYSNANLNTTAGTAIGATMHRDFMPGFGPGLTEFSVTFIDTTGRFLLGWLDFGGPNGCLPECGWPLTDAGGTLTLYGLGNIEAECLDAACTMRGVPYGLPDRTIVSGGMEGVPLSPVPEPATWGLLMLGAMVLLLGRAR